MKKTTYTTTRFDIDTTGFYVEVSPCVKNNELMYDFILCQEGYGIKMFMVGCYAKYCPENEWEEFINWGIEDWTNIFYEQMDIFESAEL